MRKPFDYSPSIRAARSRNTNPYRRMVSDDDVTNVKIALGVSTYDAGNSTKQYSTEKFLGMIGSERIPSKAELKILYQTELQILHQIQNKEIRLLPKPQSEIYKK